MEIVQKNTLGIHWMYKMQTIIRKRIVPVCLLCWPLTIGPPPVLVRCKVDHESDATSLFVTVCSFPLIISLSLFVIKLLYPTCSYPHDFILKMNSTVALSATCWSIGFKWPFTFSNENIYLVSRVAVDVSVRLVCFEQSINVWLAGVDALNIRRWIIEQTIHCERANKMDRTWVRLYQSGWLCAENDHDSEAATRSHPVGDNSVCFVCPGCGLSPGWALLEANQWSCTERPFISISFCGRNSQVGHSG